MMIDGKWYDNLTCPYCSNRHPEFLTCKRAKEIADTNRRLRQTTTAPTQPASLDFNGLLYWVRKLVHAQSTAEAGKALEELRQIEAEIPDNWSTF